jgi:uncharacterized protein YcbX
MTLESIFVYPIKGLRGISRPSARIERRGIEYDRRWMLVDEQGVFLSQRKLPKMAVLQTELTSTHLIVHSGSKNLDLSIDLTFTGPPIEVKIWSSLVTASAYSSTADDWFREVLGLPCRLVRLPDDSVRSPNPEFSKPGDEVSFADGYPVTLASQSSLDALNLQLDTPVPINRFRPNLVFSGADFPWIEDCWERISIGTTIFRVAKPCGRCLVVTIDQTTGEVTGDEPLRTLARFRNSNSAVNFSVHLIPEHSGELSTSDPILIL